LRHIEILHFIQDDRNDDKIKSQDEFNIKKIISKNKWNRIKTYFIFAENKNYKL